EGKTKEQLQQDIASLQNASKIPMLIAVDEEGGTVVRVSSNPNLRSEKFKSPQELFAEGGFEKIASDTKEKCELLNSLGINVNLAPVADVSTDPNDFIYKRSFGQDAEKTADFVETVIKTSSENNISSVLKHFPGYGNNVDTHTGIATDDRDYSNFEASDFIPFKRGIDSKVQGILVSHNIVKSMDENYPASLSPSVHDILRNKLGFTGVIMTDDLAMDAISLYTNGQDAAVLAILAGNDILILSDYETSYNNLLSAAKNGQLDLSIIDKAVFRVLAWKYSANIIK
ncbi:glycoside hydrolase family 3 N-terminal domain-containing protein, partial [Faecalibacillus faecis]|uniref:glycoside hydrolase family 3 N-terminal domain-containing protein n=1 Tax=Faecalibacillus faecis TaxID=1982628 RepID=UPI00386D4D6C